MMSLLISRAEQALSLVINYFVWKRRSKCLKRLICSLSLYLYGFIKDKDSHLLLILLLCSSLKRILSFFCQRWWRRNVVDQCNFFTNGQQWQCNRCQFYFVRRWRIATASSTIHPSIQVGFLKKNLMNIWTCLVFQDLELCTLHYHFLAWNGWKFTLLLRCHLIKM